MQARCVLIYSPPLDEISPIGVDEIQRRPVEKCITPSPALLNQFSPTAVTKCPNVCLPF